MYFFIFNLVACFGIDEKFKIQSKLFMPPCTFHGKVKRRCSPKQALSVSFVLIVIKYLYKLVKNNGNYITKICRLKF